MPRAARTAPRAAARRSRPRPARRSALGTNWAGSYAYRARELHRPSTLEELQEVLACAPRIRVLGSRHTFSDIADSDALVSLDGLPDGVEIENGTVTLGGAMRYGDLA